MTSFYSSNEWDWYYGTARWKRRRAMQLRDHPLCAYCLARGIPVPASVCDHITPHKGDWMLFVTGDLQSLCEPCHKSAKRAEELRGYRLDRGADGYPLDPAHPWYRAK